ncbi:hypothetical protein Bhyg_05872 [Pseudolycoriella hygida]|uniref:Uncharacterized protein n=1 Tax=Pseudolycoriella hygida TaxID=35572 RepID=A0A9Q0MZT1_9DIPT|nr:hypothetical protein Bhyg_05872 [Pseudolycoriella hygida]
MKIQSLHNLLLKVRPQPATCSGAITSDRLVPMVDGRQMGFTKSVCPILRSISPTKQCAAVSTYLWLMRTPPQLRLRTNPLANKKMQTFHCDKQYSNNAIQGNSSKAVDRPPYTFSPNDSTPHDPFLGNTLPRPFDGRGLERFGAGALVTVS